MSYVDKIEMIETVKEINTQIKVLEYEIEKAGTMLKGMKDEFNDFVKSQGFNVHNLTKDGYILSFVNEVEKVEAARRDNLNYNCDWYRRGSSGDHYFILRRKFEKSFAKNLNNALFCNLDMLKGAEYKTVRFDGKSTRCNVFTDAQMKVIKDYVSKLREK